MLKKAAGTPPAGLPSTARYHPAALYGEAPRAEGPGGAVRAPADRGEACRRVLAVTFAIVFFFTCSSSIAERGRARYRSTTVSNVGIGGTQRIVGLVLSFEFILDTASISGLTDIAGTAAELDCGAVTGRPT